MSGCGVMALGVAGDWIFLKEDMSLEATQIEQTQRMNITRRGLNLEYLTVAYNSLEGLIAIIAGFIAGSIVLIGFGFDSVIEVTSGTVLLWRLYTDLDEEWRERVEAITLRNEFFLSPIRLFL